MTKLLGLGALGAGGYAAVRAIKNARARRQQQQQMDAFDYGDFDEPVIVTEEVVVVTEAGPYEIDMELVPNEEVNQDQTAQQQQGAGDGSSFDMPGRGAAPR